MPNGNDGTLTFEEFMKLFPGFDLKLIRRLYDAGMQVKVDPGLSPSQPANFDSVSNILSIHPGQLQNMGTATHEIAHASQSLAPDIFDVGQLSPLMQFQFGRGARGFERRAEAATKGPLAQLASLAFPGQKAQEQFAHSIAGSTPEQAFPAEIFEPIFTSGQTLRQAPKAIPAPAPALLPSRPRIPKGRGAMSAARNRLFGRGRGGVQQF